jgi:hypothetical protein
MAAAVFADRAAIVGRHGQLAGALTVFESGQRTVQNRVGLGAQLH